MKKSKYDNSRDIKLFKQAFQGIKKITQDTVLHSQHSQLNTKMLNKKNMYLKDYHSNFFNYNHYIKKLITTNPVSYARNILAQHELKKLKNKYYVPEISLDVHGCSQLQVKKELGKLIFICRQKKINCCSIIHGHGKNILKKQIPVWLSQHPDIIAFFQSPNIVRYYTTLLVLVDHD